MKSVRLVLITVGFLVVAAAVWAGGKQEAQIAGPPYDVATVKQILSNDALYQEGYLQREMDRNGDGTNDETGNRIYVGALRNFRDANGDGLDDATGGELPLGLRNRLIDQNGDGIVDGSEEPVGQYVNRIRVEAQLRYEQGEGDQTRTRTQTREESRTETQSSGGSQDRKTVGYGK